MSITVDQTWIEKFHNVLHLTYQQMDSMLRSKLAPGMVHTDISAAIDYHDRLGNVVANDVVVPGGQLVPLNPVHSIRAVTVQSSEGSIRVFDENSLRAMINPTSGYTQTLAAAMQRRSDKHIIDALTGAAATATVVNGVRTLGSQALPSARWVTSIAGTSALSLANVIAAHVKLSKSGVPVGAARRTMLYTPGQETNILNITQASSSDFTKNRIHDTGTVDGQVWEGFTWVSIVWRSTIVVSDCRLAVRFNRRFKTSVQWCNPSSPHRCAPP